MLSAVSAGLPLLAGELESSSLTLPEKHAIHKYTMEGSDEIPAYNRKLNCDLRQGATLSPEYQEMFTLLTGGLRKLPAHVETVTRYVSIASEELMNAQPGDVVREKGFMSTSAGPSQSPDCPVQLVIVGGHSGGKDISGFSEYYAETEILFPSNTELKVLDRADYEHGTYFTLEEVSRASTPVAVSQEEEDENEFEEMARGLLELSSY